MKKRKDGRYQASVALSGGQRKVIYGKTKTELKQKIIMAHEADNLAPMFDKVAHDWYSDFWRTVSPKTLSQYDPVFDRIVVQFGNKRIDEIEPANIQAFLNDLKIKGYSASYVKTHRMLREIASSRMALINLYESRDRALYAEAPQLRKKYMDTIGIYEEPVLQAELEVAVLRRKVEIIQIAINRREPIDLEAIDARLEEEKQARISALEKADKTLNELPQLDEQQLHTLQRQYREITASFHPAMNPGLSDTQKELYQKAVEAYSMQDVESMKLIYNMLFKPLDLSGIPVIQDNQDSSVDERRADYLEIATELSTDYYLAKKLYKVFAPLEEDQIVLDMLHKYDVQRKEVEREIEQIRSGFPFNATDTLNDRNKTEEYLAELRLRSARCEREKRELETQIASLMEGRKDG